MNCMCLETVTSLLEQWGLYEPELSIEEANRRLTEEQILWNQCNEDRSQSWKVFQSGGHQRPLIQLVTRAIVAWEGQMGAQPGIAVDLGCGISPTVIALLERGWTVYAVDQSAPVIAAVKELTEEWIQTGRLVLVNQSIEDFEFPQQVQLILATDSLPYCNPLKIYDIFLKARQALVANGVFACSFFPYHTEVADNLMRSLFGGWLTTRNVIHAVASSVQFKDLSITSEPSPSGFAQQIHLLARA